MTLNATQSLACVTEQTHETRFVRECVACSVTQAIARFMGFGRVPSQQDGAITS